MRACAGEGVVTLNVATGEPVTLNHLGPVIVTPTGGLRRVTNWNELTESERKVHKLGRSILGRCPVCRPLSIALHPSPTCTATVHGACSPSQRNHCLCKHVQLHDVGELGCAQHRQQSSCAIRVTVSPLDRLALIDSRNRHVNDNMQSRSRAPWVLGTRSFSTDLLSQPPSQR